MAVFKSKEKTKDGRIWYFKSYKKDIEGNNKAYKSKKYLTKREAEEAEALFLLKRDNPSRKNFSIVAMDYLFIEWWPKPGSNRRHKDFQSSALPAELPGLLKKMAIQKGLEPSISSVTGRHVNHYTTGPINVICLSFFYPILASLFYMGILCTLGDSIPTYVYLLGTVTPAKSSQLS